jgi:hypothetical protein
LSPRSYGRQLGRVMDALAVLIADLPKAKQDATAFEEFTKIRREIDDIKAKLQPDASTASQPTSLR